jgi:hypothetical protein
MKERGKKRARPQNEISGLQKLEKAAVSCGPREILG